MPIDDDALLAAMNTGIAEANGALAPAPVSNEPAGGDDDVDSSGSDQQDADGSASAAGGEGEGASAGEPQAAAAGSADGDDKPAEGGETPAAGSATGGDQNKDQDAGSPPAAAKPADPLNDPLPNALKKETKERIHTLVGMVKENTTRLEAVTRDRDDLLDAIVQTRATPTQYSQALQYLGLVNSSKREDREMALHFMQQEVAALARMLGKPVPGVNMLEGHQDLIDEVSTGRLSPDRAQEIAAARVSRQFQQQEAAVNEEQVRNANAANKARLDGINALNDLGKQLRARDGAGYKVRAGVLIQSLKPVFARIPPDQWADTFRRAYEALPAPAAPRPNPAAPARAAGGGGGNTPLRAGNPAGGAAAAPKTLEEAINFGIAQAG